MWRGPHGMLIVTVDAASTVYLSTTFAPDLNRRPNVNDNVRVRPGRRLEDTRGVDLEAHAQLT
jgi:hypothetical protein